MDEKSNGALVRKSSSAVEKVAPRAKRVLSGIVADALALRNKQSVRIVVVDDEENIFRAIEIVVRAKYKNVSIQTFQDSKEAWQELLRKDPDLLITRDVMPGLTGKEIVRRLVDRKVTYPIVVGGGWPPTEEWVREYTVTNSNITYLCYLFTVEQLYERLSKYLGSSDNPQP